ncbi:MAG TPA: hypothetical protein VM734_17850 [Kofleriaceae bacterium]|nr:hypothetical protein [Kofleriaceae bacterium]
MGLALFTAVTSVVAGLAAAIAAHARLWVLAPVRAFAIVAVAAAIAVHILPEAIDGAGWWVLVPLIAGFFAPPLIGRAARAVGTHRRVAAELGYAGVLVHQLGDGLGLGAVTGAGHAGHVHWDFLLGLGAHTVPLVAVVALAFAELGGRRAAIARAAGLLAATMVGVALTRADDSLMLDAGPWINAAVAGLLFHVLLHDADDRDVPAAARPLEALGAAAGAALPFLFAADEHGHDGHGAITGELRHDLIDVALALAPIVVVGGALAVLLAPGHRRAPRSIAGVVTGPLTVLGLIVAAYAVAARRSAGAAGELAAKIGDLAAAVPDPVAVVAAVTLAAAILLRIATGGFMAWLGGGRHDHADAHHAHHDHHAP